VLFSRAVKTYCGDDNGRSSENRTERKNTAADGCERNRITAAVARVDRDMLTRVWNEMDYRIHVCRITKGGYIEHL
jgi:hypothetical protein